MIEIALHNVVKAFEKDKNILDGVTFDVNSGERVGLLGKNGAGKTTLFRVISGEYECDKGDALTAPGHKVGLLEQIAEYPPDFTVEDVLRRAQEPQTRLLERLNALAATLDSPERIREYDNVAHEVERLDAYNLDYKRDVAANGLNIPQSLRGSLFSTLSGGEKTRVNLARLLLEDCDILLLDEPTNHLDMRASAWLEDYLVRSGRTLLVISHDRYFLDQVVTRVVELVEGKAELYSGNYSFFAEEKQRIYEETLLRFERQEREYKRLMDSALRMKSYAGGQNEALVIRARSMMKRAERLRTLDKPRRDSMMRASFASREMRSDDLMLAYDLSMSFDGRTLFGGVDLELKGGERVALIGDNGTGKTTLLNILTGREKPDSGAVRFSPSAKTAFLEQLVLFQSRNRSVLDTVLYETNCAPQEARDRLGAFKFSGEDVYKPVSVLSGGELSRLRLCILMREKINLLILDEPTNHLDIASREWIEDALDDYDEALLFVSHDRYFIERFATKIWVLDGGKVTEYLTTFSEYEKLAASTTSAPSAKPQKPAKPKKDAKPADPAKLLLKLEQEIAYAERDLSRIDAEIDANASDFELLTVLFAEKQETQAKLDALYQQWEELSGD